MTLAPLDPAIVAVLCVGWFRHLFPDAVATTLGFGWRYEPAGLQVLLTSAK